MVDLTSCPSELRRCLHLVWDSSKPPMKRGPRTEKPMSIWSSFCWLDLCFEFHVDLFHYRSLEQMPEQLILIDISDFEMNDHYHNTTIILGYSTTNSNGSNVSSQPKYPTQTYQDVNCKLTRQASARSNSPPPDLGLHVPGPWTDARLVRHAPLCSHRR